MSIIFVGSFANLNASFEGTLTFVLDQWSKLYFSLNVQPEILTVNGLYSPWLKWRITLVSTEYCCLHCGKAVTVTARGAFRSSLARANVPFFYISRSSTRWLTSRAFYIFTVCEEGLGGLLYLQQLHFYSSNEQLFCAVSSRTTGYNMAEMNSLWSWSKAPFPFFWRWCWRLRPMLVSTVRPIC